MYLPSVGRGGTGAGSAGGRAGIWRQRSEPEDGADKNGCNLFVWVSVLSRPHLVLRPREWLSPLRRLQHGHAALAIQKTFLPPPRVTENIGPHAIKLLAALSEV